MPKTNPLENLFNFVKKLGKYSEYSSYQDFKEKKYGEGLTDEERQQQIEDDYRVFKSELPPEDKVRFEEIFEEEKFSTG